MIQKRFSVFSNKSDAIERARENVSLKVYEFFARKDDLLPLYVSAPTKPVAMDRYLEALYADADASERVGIAKRIESVIRI